MKLGSIIGSVVGILFWVAIGWWIYNTYFATHYKITGFGDVKLGEKTREFTRNTDFMSFDKFGCKVTKESSKCYSVYYMFEDPGYPFQKERPDINKIISALKEKYKSGGDCTSDPLPLYLHVFGGRWQDEGRWRDLCDSNYFSGNGDDIQWFTVFSLDDQDRTINLCVSGDLKIEEKYESKYRPNDPWKDVSQKTAVKNDGNLTQYGAPQPISKKYRVLLFAYDRHLYFEGEKESAEKTKKEINDGL